MGPHLAQRDQSLEGRQRGQRKALAPIWTGRGMQVRIPWDRTSPSATKASKGVSVGSAKPSPQSMDRRGQATCTQACGPASRASLPGATSDSSTCAGPTN